METFDKHMDVMDGCLDQASAVECSLPDRNMYATSQNLDPPCNQTNPPEYIKFKQIQLHRTVVGLAREGAIL